MPMTESLSTLRKTIVIHFVPRHKGLLLSDGARALVDLPLELRTFVIDAPEDVKYFMDCSGFLFDMFLAANVEDELVIFSECGGKHRVVKCYHPTQASRQVWDNLEFSKKQNVIYDIIWLAIIGSILYLIFG